MALTTAQIQNAYVAFFNRPADVAGLNYWSAYAGSLADLYNTFAQSAEYTSIFSGLNNTQKVNAVYNNLLGHAPDTAGLNYWVLKLDQGALTVANLALAIVNGAQGTDQTVIANKVSAATTYTTSLDTTAEINAYASANTTGMNAVKTWLSTVTDTAASLTSATSTATIATLNATVAANSNVNPGVSLALTAGVDTLVGGTGNDTITGTDLTATALDNIDGGAGTDTLTINDAAGAAANLAALTVKNVESLTLNSSTGLKGAAATLTGWTGLTSATVSLAAAAAGQTVTVSDTTALTVTNSAAQTLTTSGGSSVNVTNGAAAVTIGGAAIKTATVSGGTTVGVTDSSTKGDVLTSLTVSGNAGAVTTTTTNALTTVSLTNTTQAATIGNATASHTQNLTLNAVTGGATITDAAATTVNVTTATKASNVNLAIGAATALSITAGADLTIAGGTFTALKTVTATGAGALTADVSAVGTVTDVNLSAATGTHTIGIDGTKATFEGGSGRDVVTITAAPTKLLDGGTGTTDELVVNAGTDILSGNTKYTNFEVLGLGTAATGTYTATGFTGLHIGSTVTGAVTFASVAAGTTLAIDAAPGQDVTYTLKDATGKADAVSLTVSTATTAGVDFSGKNIDLSGIEAVTLNSLGTGTGTNVVKLVDTSATSLTITGGEATTVTLAGATGLASVDASAVTKAVDLSAVAVAATGATIKGSATAASVLVGGAGNDTITGGTAADTITTSTGLDTITGNGGNDTFVLAVNANGNTYATITDANKGDILTFANKGTETFTTAKITLAGTAVFQDYLDAATAGDGSTNGAIKWFQFGGDTYAVEDVSAAATFQNGADLVVKLTGLVDLATATGAGTNIITIG